MYNPYNAYIEAEAKKGIRIGRYAILLTMILTVVNLVLRLLDTEFFILYSSSFAFYLTFLAQILGGARYLIAAIAVSIAILAGLMMCWLCWWDGSTWQIGALVFLVLDTLFLILVEFFQMESLDITDSLIHIWAIVVVINSMRCFRRLQKMQTTE